jgi:hypothetical protein
MIQFHQQPDADLEMHLDGLLQGEPRVEFQRRLDRDPELRREIELQDRVDQSIRRLFAPSPMKLPTSPATNSVSSSRTIAPSVSRTRSHPSSWRSRVAAIAAILAFVIGAWSIVLNIPRTNPRYTPPSWQSLEAIYAQRIDQGFEPDWICDNEIQFERAFLGQYDQALQLRPTPSSIQTLGLAYANTMSERTMMLLARVDGEPVMVFIDRLNRDTNPTLAEDSPLTLHQTTIGSLVLYEMSPFGRPRVLEYFHEPTLGDPDRSGR